MKLFYSPDSCALAIHIILEEIGKPYELALVNLRAGEQYKLPYIALNPKSKVPALQRDDGTLLTELPAIAWYLARSTPAAGLLPDGSEGEVRLLELVDYMVSTVHMRGFTRIFRPGVFTPTTADEPAVQQTGKDLVKDGLKLLAQALGAKAYLLGDYTIADVVLFYLEDWAVRRAGLDLPEALAGHRARMRERPAVQRALAAEGLP
ncbi:MAG TPA: glutathione S-transferase N-terminal domain-containing protein [Acidocella sp.]|jgi:glutathione S-transferase|nr:glutathione S-transferase N-terminal domain-containing protein [Acidocella sp.]